MKNRKKIIQKTAALMIAFMVASAVSAPVYAAEAGTETNTEKEEVIYAMMDASGDVTGVYAVNIFTGKSSIVDYGEYSTVKNLTTEDPISYENGKVTISTDAEKLYYQGDMETKDIPWNIAIHYYMDGTEYAPEDMAGKSGALKITMDITQNMACDDSFYEGYALQATMTLDSVKTQNLSAEGATIANVGSDKQLSYIILPNKGKNIEVTADVTDFEMEAITINGVRLDLDVEYDDSAIQDKISEITDAATKLDDGASDLKDGAKKMLDGSEDLSDGASDLRDGAGDLSDGIDSVNSALKKLNSKSEDLTDGSATVYSSLKKINSSLEDVKLDTDSLSKLASASSEVKKGIDSLASGLSTLQKSVKAVDVSSASALADKNEEAAKTLSAMNTDGQFDSMIKLLKTDAEYINESAKAVQTLSKALDSDGDLMAGASKLKEKYAAFDESVQTMSSSIKTMAENMSTLKSGISTLTKKYKELDAGIKEYTEAVAKIKSAFSKVTKGADSLEEGAKALEEGTKSVQKGASDLYDGTVDMSDGTNEFKDKTSDIDEQVTDTIDDTIADMTGSEVKTISFVSEKDTAIDSVLFVMKTTAVEIKEETTEEVQEEKEETLIGKLLDLFRGK